MEKYMGMSYEQMSRKGEELIRKANQTGNWTGVVEDLAFLNMQMKLLNSK